MRPGSILRAGLLILLLFPGVLQAESFPTGSESSHVWDYAHVLSENGKSEIQHSCRSFHEQSGSNIWIVTVPNLSKYGTKADNLTEYSKRFLSEKLTQFGADDQSVLILLSKEERKCRIQLGEGWGRGWDRDCKGIMQDRGVPAFQEKQYSEGLDDIVTALTVMANRKKETSPAVLALADWGGRITSHSPLPSPAVLPSLLLALALFLGGLFNRSPQTKGLAPIGFLMGLAVLYGGVALDLLASREVHWGYKLTSILTVLGALKLLGLDRPDNRRNNRGGGYGSSGEEGSSSSGGDGGATGSW